MSYSNEDESLSVSDVEFDDDNLSVSSDEEEKPTPGEDMATGIPPNFEEHWDGANVILRTQNSNGKELHANKEFLGDNSSYFNAMFFSGFREANEDSIELDCDYKYMLIMLQTIHKTNKNGRLEGASSVEDLAGIYRLADFFDFPSIRNMFLGKTKKIGADLATIVRVGFELENHDILMNGLKKMSPDELRRFLWTKNEKRLFCKKDVVFVYEKIEGVKLEERPYGLKKKRYSLPEVVKREGEVPIELKTKWLGSDVAISTREKKPKDPILYSKIEVLAQFFKKYNKMFITRSESSVEADGFFSVHLDVDYRTMKTILYILHNYRFSTGFSPLLLYDMYRVAKDFDIPIIRKFVYERLVEEATAECLEVALKLDLQHVLPGLLRKMYAEEFHEWVLTGDEDLAYDDVIISSKATDLNLSLNDLRLIYWTIHREYENLWGRRRRR